MEISKLKRRRTPNFTSDEKLRFVRLLEEKGQCIVSKVTSHDASSNKEKELAWSSITRIHNSSGDIMRTTETLKKLWGKLKTEAKTYKAASRRSVSGTGGGPSKKFDDPVLDLVVEITGRASTGILNIDDCDADENIGCTTSSSIEYIDESIVLEDFPEEKITNISDNIDNQVEEIEEADKIAQEGSAAHKKIVNKTAKTGKEWADRRRPDIKLPNERTDKMIQQKRTSNRFAAERLTAEQEKRTLISQQIQHNLELHNIKVENERLKTEILKILLQKVKDADKPDLAKVAEIVFLSQYFFKNK